MQNIPGRIDKILNKFVKGTNRILGNRAKKIILYGSYARGDYHNNSDIDIMILTDLTESEILTYRDKIWDYAYDIELEDDVILSPLVKNIDKFNYWLEVNPFYMNVQKEGVVISER